MSVCRCCSATPAASPISDELQVDLAAGEVRDLTTGAIIPFAPLPPVMVTILGDGGLVAHFKKHGGFALPEG